MVPKRRGKELELHRKEVRERKEREKCERELNTRKERESAGVSYWRDKFSKMADIKGDCEHVIRVKRGRGEIKQPQEMRATEQGGGVVTINNTSDEVNTRCIITTILSSKPSNERGRNENCV